MTSSLRRLLVTLALPLALLAGTTAAVPVYLCSMDGAARRCCCPSTWTSAHDAADRDLPTLHRAPCCSVTTLAIASQSPAPPSLHLTLPAPALSAFVTPTPAAAPATAPSSTASAAAQLASDFAPTTGPPLYLRKLSLLC